MANAKKCDICGKYYDVPERNGDIVYDLCNTSMVRISRLKPDDERIDHDNMQFDSCEECLQDVIDYILTRKAESA